MTLRQDLNSDKFVITAELNPPRSASLDKLVENAKKISQLVSAVNITDNSGAAMKLCPLAASYIMQRDAGVEAVWQMTCRDRNRLGLQSDLLGGAALGLVNLLPLRGDPPQDNVAEEKCFDISTEELITAISNLKSGRDFDEKDIKEPFPDFCIGAAAHPGMPDLATQAETMKRRVDLGVEFFQTQICFETEQLDKFLESIDDELASKCLLGITPLKTLSQANFMNANVWGVDVPDKCIDAMTEALAGRDPKDDAAKADMQACGLGLAKVFIDYVKTTPLKGVHIMAIGQESVLDNVITTIT